MLVVLSPAKTLDMESTVPNIDCTRPEFLPQAETLVNVLRDLSPQQIASLMRISDPIATLNVARFQSWQADFAAEQACPAIFAFKGDVYLGLDAPQFELDELAFAQQHLRILSGLYGLLRPLDLMLPYRLEMGTRLANPGGKDLYAFWGDSITTALNAQMAQAGPVLVNLASNEYFRAVKPRQLTAPVITPVFKDAKNGKYKVISFFAKKARGLMAAYIVRHRITDPTALKSFDSAGYYFDEASSSAREWVFLRDQPPESQ